MLDNTTVRVYLKFKCVQDVILKRTTKLSLSDGFTSESTSVDTLHLSDGAKKQLF